jgi:hypothetical protein
MLSPELERLTAAMTKRPGASEAAIEAFQAAAVQEGVPVPPDYLELMRHANGLYGPVGEDGLWVRLDPIDDVLPITRGQHAPGGLLLLGSTRLGDALAIDARGPAPQLATIAVSWWGNWDTVDPLGPTLTGALEALKEMGPLPLPWSVRAGHLPDIGFVPMPHGMVRPLLETAGLKPGEMVYDLGCGDGRIVIAAARHFGAQGIGFDLNIDLVQVARANAAAAGVRHHAQFRRADIFTVDLSPADVVTLYLLRELNLRLVPQFKTLKPGARVVSYEFDVPGYPPTRDALVEYEPGSLGRVWVWEAPF